MYFGTPGSPTLSENRGGSSPLGLGPYAQFVRVLVAVKRKVPEFRCPGRLVLGGHFMPPKKSGWTLEKHENSISVALKLGKTWGRDSWGFLGGYRLLPGVFQYRSCYAPTKRFGTNVSATQNQKKFESMKRVDEVLNSTDLKHTA
eukprot:1030242-Rhodomonas_salina.1